MKKHCLLKNLFCSLLLIFSLTPILTLSPQVAAAASIKRHLPLVVKQPSTPGPTTRLVVFEGFYSPT